MFQAASVLVFASQLLLVADRVRELKVGPSCRAAVQASAGLPNRDENACLEDEKAAKTSVQKEWTQFDADQKAHCMRLLNAGGSPSYVELLTCAEMGKAVKNLNTQKNANTRRTVPAETTGSGSAGSESSDSVK